MKEILTIKHLWFWIHILIILNFVFLIEHVILDCEIYVLETYTEEFLKNVEIEKNVENISLEGRIIVVCEIEKTEKTTVFKILK